ncbi:MAG: hypothetical protein QM779_15540 [Propionicimonas sp.]|uniref:hypothetical protein n=1 Tax=Propionicimonas sp. TaxID=1955623 RepID=UPI003D146FBF
MRIVMDELCSVDGSDLPGTAAEPAISQQDIDATKKRIGDLLSAIGVTIVISIDDLNAPGSQAVAAEQITEAMAGSEELSRAVIQVLHDGQGAEGFGDVDSEDPSSVADFINAGWSGFAAPLQTKLGQLYDNLLQDRQDQLPAESIANDLQSREVLRRLFDGVAEYRPLSMAEWRGVQEATLKERSNKYLVLVDRSFTREGGDATSGEVLLGDILAAAGDNVWAGLLTQSATNEEGETDLTNQLRGRFGDQATRIAAIGKFRTSKVTTLPAGLRALLLVREISAYRDLAMSALDSASARARESFEALNDYVLIEAMAAARKEGLFELEHPLRAAQRAYAETLSLEVRGQGFADKHLSSIRAGGVEAYKNAQRDEEQIRETLREDRFLPDGFVSSLGLPIEIGDIFIVESLYPAGKGASVPAARHYVLLGQACDLTVRSSGRREPEILSVVLHEITPERAQAGEDEEAFLYPKREVGYLQSGGTDVWSVRFKKRITVPIDAVDATVFNPDGRAVIPATVSEPRPLAPGLVPRLEQLSVRAGKVIEKYAAAEVAMAEMDQREDWLRHIGASLAGASADARAGVTAVVHTESPRAIIYGIRRIGRVRNEYAARLADLATAFQGRPAFEPDVVDGISRERPAS